MFFRFSSSTDKFSLYQEELNVQLFTFINCLISIDVYKMKINTNFTGSCAKAHI
jgi:hypothetical protein